MISMQVPARDSKGKIELVTIQVEALRRLPCFVVVGIPNRRVQELVEQTRLALDKSGLEMPRSRVVVNMTPVRDHLIEDLVPTIAYMVSQAKFKENDDVRENGV